MLILTPGICECGLTQNGVSEDVMKSSEWAIKQYGILGEVGHLDTDTCCGCSHKPKMTDAITRSSEEARKDSLSQAGLVDTLILDF